jgi:hypothetical protein
MIGVGYSAIGDHVGWFGWPASMPGTCSSFAWPPSQPGSAEPLVSRNLSSGEPCMVRIWKDPFRSLSSTSAEAVPTFLMVSVEVVVVPSTCDVVIDVGVTVNRPAFSVKSARVALSAATFTAFVSDW